MLILFQLDIESVTGFNVLTKIPAVCLHVHQNREFRKSVNQSVYTQCSVENVIKIVSLV